MTELVTPTPRLLTRDLALAEPFDFTTYQLWTEANRMGMNPMPSRVESRWYRIKETDWGQVDLFRMAFNWRVVLGEDGFPVKGWCFLGPQSLRNALTAAVEYTGEGEAPGLWYKAVHTQQVRPEYMFK